MKYLIITLLGLTLFVACRKSEISPTTTPKRSVPLTLIFSSEDMVMVSRSLTDDEERAIKDINIYLCHKSLGFIKHIYTTTLTVGTNLTSGEYELFAVANFGSDMGELGSSEIASYQYRISSVSDIESGSSLVMTCNKTITVLGATNISLTLKRVAAKIDYTINVTPDFASSFSIGKVSLVNTPMTMKLFEQSKTTSSYDMFNTELSSSSGSFYMLENMQGVISSITDQRAKNRDTAPPFATYIHIQGYTLSQKVDYFIYLGENNTSDFNIGRNRHYTLAINIMGLNALDWRVSVTNLSATPLNAKYTQNELARSTLTLDCTNAAGNQYYLKYQILQGNGRLTLDGVARAADVPYQILSGSGTKSIAVEYSQADTGAVLIQFFVTDKYGSSLSVDISTVYEMISPIVVSVQQPVAGLATYTDYQFTLNLSEENYNSGFKVNYTLLGGGVVLKYNSNNITDGSDISLGAGGSTFTFSSVYIGTSRIRLTITDDNGQQKSEDITFNFSPLVIPVELDFNVVETLKTLTSGSFTGTQANPLELFVTATTQQNVMASLNFTLKVDYGLGYYSTTSSYSITPTSKIVSFTLGSGSSSSQYLVCSYTGYCMGTAPPPTSARKLLAQGYYFDSTYDIWDKSYIYKITLSLSSASTLYSHGGAIEYRVTIKQH